MPIAVGESSGLGKITPHQICPTEAIEQRRCLRHFFEVSTLIFNLSEWTGTY